MVSAGMLVTSCQNGAQETAKAKPAETKTEKKEKAYPVKIQKIEQQTIDKTVEYTANLLAFEENYIAPAAPGQITKIYVEAGDRVKKGQKLVEMDRTQLDQAIIQYKSLEIDFQRMDTLYKTGSISKQQYDQIKTQYDVLKTNIAFLRKNTTITAPYSGIITGRFFEEGEIFSGAPNTQAGKAAIVTLNQINKLKAAINVSEKYFPMLKKGMHSEIFSDIYPNDIFDARISLIYPTIDAMTRSFRVELMVPNAKETLRPGMFVRSELKLGETDAFIAPAIAVLKQEGTNNRYVFVHKNGKALRVEVELGKRFDDKLEIVSNDINKGDELIVVGQASLLDGYSVEVK